MANKLGILMILMVLMASGLVFAVVSPDQKLMAKRAAELDAYRNMAERIMGLSITSESLVMDYVSESDRITTHMDHFIKGLQIKDDQTVWFDDGTCEVVVEASLSQVINELKTTVDKYYDGNKWDRKQFDNIEKNTKATVLTEIGAGAVRHNTIITEPKGMPIVMDMVNPRSRLIDLPGIYKRYPARNRLMAKRIAAVDAYRKLIERIYGLRVTAKTTVRDFDVNMSSDIITARLMHELKGMRVEEVRYQPDGIIEMQVSVTLKQVVNTLKRVSDQYFTETGKRIKSDTFDEINTRTDRRTVTVLGMGAISGKMIASLRPAPAPVINVPASRVERIKTTTRIEKEPEVIEIR